MRRVVWLVLSLGLGLLFMVTGCSKPVVRCTSPEDNAQHHYLRGMEALEQNKTDVAREKLERAVYCDERFPPAHGGLAIVASCKAKAQDDKGYSAADAQQACDHLKKCRKQSKTDEEKFEYFLAVVRVNTGLKDKGWLEEAKDAFKYAKDLKVDERKLVYYQGTEALDYYMGLAYLEAYEFQKARDSFAEVLNAKREGKWHERADKAWKKTDKIVRAMAGITVGDVGKKIAVKDSITRGDLAALLIDEIKLDKLFAGRIPVASQVAAMKAEFTPADTMSHPFKDEILTIMKWKVRGLEPKFDDTAKAYLFKPADAVSRAEMAFILEDVLIKLTGDEKIATAFFGQDKSPFPDVKPTSAFYNAVLNMTTRGIMEGELSGEFRIGDSVDGAEALLSTRVLKQRMNIY